MRILPLRQLFTATTLAFLATLSPTQAQDGDTAELTSRLVHPISNPIYADTALPKNQATLIYAYHRLPDHINTQAGRLSLGGQAQVAALQLEYAFNERLSLTAIKDGYTWLDSDATLADRGGFNDIALGLKYLVYHEDDLAVAVRGTIELPVGDEDVFQGNGSGNVSPALIATWTRGPLQLNGVAGLVVPFDGDEESLTSYLSAGVSYTIWDRLSGLVELNWFRVLDAGDGQADFGSDQLGTTVPAVVNFEGGDLFNFGAKNGDEHPDLVTAALGLRYQICDYANIGVGYEFPLTDESNSLYKDRFYVNLAVTF